MRYPCTFTFLILAFMPYFLEAQMLPPQESDWSEKFRQEHEAAYLRGLPQLKANRMPTLTTNEAGQTAGYIGQTENGEWIFFETENERAAVGSKVRHLQSLGEYGYYFDGEGSILGEWDAGGVRLTHQELDGRVVQKDDPSSDNNHATHVAGTLIGAGVEERARGMMFTGFLHAYDWNSDNLEMEIEASEGLLISNHSYGRRAGWSYNSDSAYWEWWGDHRHSETEDYKFGFYDQKARAWDIIARNHENYLIVKSAGNNRNDALPDTVDFHYYYNYDSREWERSTLSRDPAGPFDCLPTYSTAKNILTVGAVNTLPQEEKTYTHEDIELTNFSSVGPTDDGRIKPDIVADGRFLRSAGIDSDDHYLTYSGTSMSGPTAAGSLMGLQKAHQAIHHGDPMTADLLKALAIHTATRGTDDVGPSYEYGWGLINMKKAYQVLSNDGRTSMLSRRTLHDGETVEIEVEVTDTQDLRATIVWTDIAGTPPSTSLNPPDLMLVNDLDLRIEDADEQVYEPFILDPENPEAAAERGDNFRDNVEQVLLEKAAPGTYTIRISHKGNISQLTQKFALVVSGITTPQVAADQCDGLKATYEQNFGKFNDGSGWAPYFHHQNCSWEIHPRDADDLVHFSIDNLSLMEEDSLLFYAQTPNGDSLVAAYHGHHGDIPLFLEVPSAEVLVRFKSGHQNEFHYGWEMSYALQSFDSCYDENRPEISTENNKICEGESSTLTFNNAADFEAFYWSNEVEDIAEITVEESGTFSVFAMDDRGCTYQSNQIAVSVNPKPEVPEIEVRTVDDTEQIFTVQGFSYEWFRNGNRVNFAEAYFLDDPLGGMYEVTITNEYGCSSSSDVFEFVPVSRTAEAEGSWKLFPNPAHTYLTVEYNAEVKTNALLEVLNLQGKTIQMENIGGQNSVQLDVSNFAKGMYFIRITAEDEQFLKRFIKQ